MERFLGARIKRAARHYVEIIPIGKAKHGECRLTTLSPDQGMAEIDILLLGRPARRGEPQEPRELKHIHHFTVRNTRKDDGTRPLLTVSAQKTGWRKYNLTVAKDGRTTDSATLRVPPSPLSVFIIATVVVALIASIALFQTCRSRPAGMDGPAEVSAEIPAEVPADVPADDRVVEPSITSPPEVQGADQGENQSEVQEEAQSATTIEPITRTFTVYYHPDSNRPTADGMQTLEEITDILVAHDIVEITVEGHTALFGNEAGRRRISEGRVDAVLAHAADEGWDEDIQPQRVLRGSSAPVTRSMEQQHLNRRAEVTITYRPDQS